MNKVHINLDTSENPQNISIICKKNDVKIILATRKIEKATIQPQALRIITSD